MTLSEARIQLAETSALLGVKEAECQRLVECLTSARKVLDLERQARQMREDELKEELAEARALLAEAQRARTRTRRSPRAAGQAREGDGR